MSTNSDLSWRRIFAYGAPAFALAMPTIPAFVYLPALYADSLGLATAGLVLLGARIVDVVSDPLIGVLSDRHKTRWGRRKPWIMAGALLAGFALIQLFQPPGDVTAPYLLIWAVLLYLGWTMVAVPYTAWGAELSGDYNQRSQITGVREGLTLVGILAAGSVPAITASMGWTEGEGLAAVSWLAIAVGAPTIFVLLWRVPEAGSGPRATSSNRINFQNLLKAARILGENKPFVRILSAWFINGMANGIPAALFLLYLEFGLNADQTQRSVLILAYFLSGVLSIPLWLHLSRKVGKHRAWCWAMILTCAAFIWVPFLAPGDIALFAIICVVTGMGLGADLVLPPALQADVIDFDELRSGQSRAGLFFALWSMSTKLALAAAVGLAFPALEALGFSTDGENSLSALRSLAVIYAGVPVVLKLIAIAVIWTFPITQKRQELIRKRLNRRQIRFA